ncbi:hypothetical protein CIB48_g3709 [Xylaria polymorpha]|nr:hypothetical protein CIB48_g3709 [Xylaria polymorpha]
MPHDVTKTAADNGVAEQWEIATRRLYTEWVLEIVIGRSSRRMTSAVALVDRVDCRPLRSDREAMTASGSLMMDHQKRKSGEDGENGRREGEKEKRAVERDCGPGAEMGLGLGTGGLVDWWTGGLGRPVQPVHALRVQGKGPSSTVSGLSSSGSVLLQAWWGDQPGLADHWEQAIHQPDTVTAHYLIPDGKFHSWLPCGYPLTRHALGITRRPH